jgi:hypothetical protein
MDKLGADDVHNMVGLEFYLSNKILMSTHVRRKAHVDAILEAHECHCNDFYNDAEVSLISRQSSEWVSSKCHQVAAICYLLDGFAEIDGDIGKTPGSTQEHIKSPTRRW